MSDPEAPLWGHTTTQTHPQDNIWVDLSVEQMFGVCLPPNHSVSLGTPNVWGIRGSLGGGITEIFSPAHLGRMKELAKGSK